MLIRPLGIRDTLLAFEMQGEYLFTDEPPLDVRETFILWSPQGRPYVPYPDMTLARPMTGREVMLWQAQAWAAHVSLTRALFGYAPLAGIAAPNRPLRGVLAFPIALSSHLGRWTLAHRAGWQWHFSFEQLRDGLPRAVPPAKG